MSQVRFLEVTAEHAGQRLDNYLQRELKGVPKTRLYRALRKGEIRVNKGRVKADYRLRAGDSVRIPPIRVGERQPLQSVPERWQNLEVLYEDAGLLVINKPSGLAVHGGSGIRAGLIECLRLLRPEDRYLELVHRLDRDTSGCILVAKKSSILKELHRQLRGDEVDKRYLALVTGSWPRQRSFVDAPLQKNTLQSGERMVRVDKEGRRARTDFRVVERYPAHTLIEAKPITGRTHQIRVHAQHAGHPLCGDEKYARKEQLQYDQRQGLSRLFLHAASLNFTLPEKGRIEVAASLPQDLESYLDKVHK